MKRIVATLDWPDEQIIRFCEDGRSVMRRLSEMPFPSVAAIHGACVGGGLELAMWCDRRIACDDRKTVLGLPEVKLGLVPGWAGTVRLPRMTNLEIAIDLITSGRNANATEALKIGLISEVAARESLVDTAFRLIEQLNTSRSYLDDRQQIMGPVSASGDLNMLKKTYGNRIQANEEVYPFACHLVLEHLIETSSLSHELACHGESLAMAKAYGSEPSFGLLNHFFLGDHNRKKPGLVDIKLAEKMIANVGIVGSGLMGRNIADIVLKRKCSVVLYDADEEVLDSALSHLLKDNLHTPLVKAQDYSDFADCDLVIESVVEVEEIKKTVLERIENSVSQETLIATNTSAIPLTKLGQALRHPERFCGIHFCHPQLMQLVEVVRGSQSSETTVADAAAWVKGLRKMPVVVADQAGFVVNRMLAAMLDQSFRLFSNGKTIEELDQAIRDFGFKGGPFEIVDVIGVEVCMYAGREMWDAGKQCVTMTPVLPRMVKQGWLGRKTGQGFYRYEAIDGERIWDPKVDELLTSYVDPIEQKIDIAESVCAVMVLEAARLLDEGVVADPRDIDLSVINGFSFPAHVGGILFWADRHGIEKVNDVLRELAKQDSKLAPTKRMTEMESSQCTFYNEPGKSP